MFLIQRNATYQCHKLKKKRYKELLSSSGKNVHGYGNILQMSSHEVYIEGLLPEDLSYCGIYDYCVTIP